MSFFFFLISCDFPKFNTASAARGTHLHISGNAIFHTVEKREEGRGLIFYRLFDRFGESRTKCENVQGSLLPSESKSKNSLRFRLSIFALIVRAFIIVDVSEIYNVTGYIKINAFYFTACRALSSCTEGKQPRNRFPSYPFSKLQALVFSQEAYANSSLVRRYKKKKKKIKRQIPGSTQEIVGISRSASWRHGEFTRENIRAGAV